VRTHILFFGGRQAGRGPFKIMHRSFDVEQRRVVWHAHCPPIQPRRILIPSYERRHGTGWEPRRAGSRDTTKKFEKQDLHERVLEREIATKRKTDQH
jgi:hypothetical protein